MVREHCAHQNALYSFKGLPIGQHSYITYLEMNGRFACIQSSLQVCRHVSAVHLNNLGDARMRPALQNALPGG